MSPRTSQQRTAAVAAAAMRVTGAQRGARTAIASQRVTKVRVSLPLRRHRGPVRVKASYNNGQPWRPPHANDAEPSSWTEDASGFGGAAAASNWTNIDEWGDSPRPGDWGEADEPTFMPPTTAGGPNSDSSWSTASGGVPSYYDDYSYGSNVADYATASWPFADAMPGRASGGGGAPPPPPPPQPNNTSTSARGTVYPSDITLLARRDAVRACCMHVLP